ncbi:rhodanese-like domain-containing protein [Paenibacillus physcomitrellae]|uniref:Rhodanese-like domain-containing protein n=1 Tax=Paenibacillus physcomitrellae TaxID=1619311 RepID=A0ABQ1FSQ0_9BACL|nr:rhodanese-like domain-containing protein [Paenibacillus physcomitrellae]GGA29538.1 rhodanese-like domain-containing protein [Paenibacillus physcomitrellae]
MAFKVPKEISPEQLEERLHQGETVMMLDVREPGEWFEGHLPGAKHIPLGALPERCEELDRNKEWVVMCRSGGRSGLACEILHERGFKVVNLTGGLLRWTGELSGERESN